ncbi:hypothetical protein VU04_11665 [Desulfobulbus sp. TB]|nr:hypothetical protein [Desulfobulbus sp. TB]
METLFLGIVAFAPLTVQSGIVFVQRWSNLVFSISPLKSQAEKVLDFQSGLAGRPENFLGLRNLLKSSIMI